MCRNSFSPARSGVCRIFSTTFRPTALLLAVTVRPIILYFLARTRTAPSALALRPEHVSSTTVVRTESSEYQSILYFPQYPNPQELSVVVKLLPSILYFPPTFQVSPENVASKVPLLLKTTCPLGPFPNLAFQRPTRLCPANASAVVMTAHSGKTKRYLFICVDFSSVYHKAEKVWRGRHYMIR